MFVAVPYGVKYYGLSSDAKPTPKSITDGTELIETDTGREFYVAGGAWQPKTQNDDSQPNELFFIRRTLEEMAETLVDIRANTAV